MKRAISVFLAVTIILSTVSTTASANEQDLERIELLSRYSKIVERKENEGGEVEESFKIAVYEAVEIMEKESVRKKVKRVNRGVNKLIDLYNGAVDLMELPNPLDVKENAQHEENRRFNVQIMKVNKPWRCIASEIRRMNNDVGIQYEAMYDQVVKEIEKCDQFIVRLKDGITVDTLESLANTTVVLEELLSVGSTDYSIISLAEKVVPEEYMKAIGGAVLFSQPDFELELCSVSAQAQELSIVSGSDYFDQIDMNAAETIFEDRKVVIALLDTGIDMEHPDLKGHFENGWNFINDTDKVVASGVSLGQAHGTHIAGIIVDTAPNVVIMPLQVFEYGKAHTSDIINAIQYAEMHGAQVVNCSWGYNKANPLLLEVMKDSNMLFVAAAGNNCANVEEEPFYPACFDLENVISVTSIDEDGEMSYFSNFGPSVDYAAKGFDIQSTIPGGGYGKMSGTSVAAGAVSAILGLTMLENKAISDLNSQLVIEAPNLVNKWSENSENFTSLKAKSLSAGASFSLSLKENGTVWAWGANDFGQCGIHPSEGVPVQIPGLLDIKEIAAGWTHGMALDGNGNLWAWGSNTYGELGDGTTVSKKVPMKVMGMQEIRTIRAAGLDNTSVAIGKDGQLWYWGKTKDIVSLTPQNLQKPQRPDDIYPPNAPYDPSIQKFVFVYGGYYDCFMGVDAEGSVWEWTIDEDGVNAPERHRLEILVDDINAGYNFVVVWDVGRDVAFGRGTGAFNEFGDFPNMLKDKFQVITQGGGPGGLLFDEIENVATTCSSVIVTDKNCTECAGDNSFYKNGDDGNTRGFSCFYDGAHDICGGMSHTIFIGGDGREYAVGSNSRGYLGVDKETIKEDCEALPVGFCDIKPKAVEAERLYIKDGPLFMKKSELLELVKDTFPSTLTVYVEDGVNSFDCEYTWNGSYADDFFITPEGLVQRSIYGDWVDECWPKTFRLRVDAEIVIESLPEEIIDIPSIDTIIVNEGVGWQSIFYKLDEYIPVELSISGSVKLPVLWRIPDLSFPLKKGVYTVTGEFMVPEGTIRNPEFVPTVSVVVGGIAITEIPEIEVTVGPETSVPQLLSELPKEISVVLEDGTTSPLSVTWSTDNYDPSREGETQILTGTVTLEDGITNPNNLPAKALVTVGRITRPIKAVNVSSLSVDQNIYLTPVAPADVPEDYGLIETVDLPEMVTAILEDGETVEVPVLWDVSEYDPTQVGKQEFIGELLLLEEHNLSNPRNLPAKLEVTVVPKSYQTMFFILMYEPLEVYPGTTFDQMSEQAQKEGKLVYVLSLDLDSGDDMITVCPISFMEEDNPGFTKDIPGEYTLLARLPDNFVSLDDPDITATTSYTVVVMEPQVIERAETARMDAYQSVSPGNLKDIPTQVNVTLENGMVIPVDVEWDWGDYESAKDVPGEHIISGKLINLPSIAVQPEGQDVIPVMIVNNIPVDYIITGLQSDNLYEADAGLSLDELTEILKPVLTFEITSTTAGIDLVTDYTVSVTLEDEKNPEFDPQVDGFYPVMGTLALPDNITCPTVEDGDPYEQIILFTYPVDVKSVEPVYMFAEEGTPFAELKGLPTQVIVTLSSVGVDGKNKKITTGVDWGTGEGYTPFPEGLTDNTPVTMEVTGLLDNYPSYVNGAGKEASLFITMTRVYDLVAVAPSRIPDAGSMAVNLGASLGEIYTQIEDHSVELTLQNRRGESHTATVTFLLREEENRGYDPLTLGEHTLTGYIPLADNIRNPDGLGVELVVEKKKYTISSSKVVQLTGVESGTPFENIGLPELVTVVRSDGGTEDIPVKWDGSNYNPTRIGSQAVRGAFVTPLPIHLENPNKRQANAIVKVVSASARILSLEQLTQDAVVFSANEEITNGEPIPGFEEYHYLAEIMWEDGSTSFQVISVFVETATA